MSSSLMSRMMLALRGGMSFGGLRDYYTVFGWNRAPKISDLVAKYERQDVCRRVVNKPPEDTWSTPPSLYVGETLVKVWDEIAFHTALWPAITQADKLCNFGEYSTLLLGLPGVLDTPAKKAKPEEILYVQAYSSVSMTIKTLVDNEFDARFGLPAMYTLTLGEDILDSATSTSKNSKKITKDVHWTRVIHIVDNPVQGNLYSTPRLLPLYNVLDDILKIAGGSAEMFWLTANRGMQIDIDKDMTLGTDDAEALDDELEEFQHQLRRYIRTRGVKITNLGSEVADPRGTFTVLMYLLSGATGIPQRILLGSEAGQLASEQDRANWAEQVINRRAVLAEPYILRPLIERLIYLGILEDIVYTYMWPEAFRLSPLEKAQTMAQQARAIANISRQVTNGFPLVTQEEGREMIGLTGTAEGLTNVPLEAQKPGQATSNPEQPDGQEAIEPVEGDPATTATALPTT